MRPRFQAPQQPDVWRPEPARQNDFMFTLTAGAFLPFWQALITGVFLGLALLIVAVIARAREPWLWGLLGMVVGVGATWGLALRHWYSLTRIERATGLDLNGDGVVGRKPEKPVVHVTNVRMNMARPGGHLAQIVASFPASPEQLKKLAAGILSVPPVPFTVRAWCRDRNTFTDNELERLRDAFLQARDPEGNELLKPVSDKGTKKGFEFTEAGKQLLSKILHEEVDD